MRLRLHWLILSYCYWCCHCRLALSDFTPLVQSLRLSYKSAQEDCLARRQHSIMQQGGCLHSSGTSQNSQNQHAHSLRIASVTPSTRCLFTFKVGRMSMPSPEPVRKNQTGKRSVLVPAMSPRRAEVGSGPACGTACGLGGGAPA